MNTLSERGKRTGENTPSLNPSWTGTGSLTVGPEGPLVRFDQSPPSSFSVPSGGGTPAIAAGDWRFRSRNRSHPRVQGVEAVPSVGVTVSGVDGVVGGELRGRRRASGAR